MEVPFLEPACGTNWVSDLRNIKDPRRTLDDWKKTGGYFRGANHKDGLWMEPQCGFRNGTLSTPADGKAFCACDCWCPPSRVNTMSAARASVGESRSAVVDTPEIDALAKQTAGAGVSYSGGRPAAGPARVDVLLQPMVEMPYGVKGFENEDRSPKDKQLPVARDCIGLCDRKKPSPEETPAPFVTLQAIEVERVTSHCATSGMGFGCGRACG